MFYPYGECVFRFKRDTEPRNVNTEYQRFMKTGNISFPILSFSFQH